jgi:hypothetical protein
MSAAFAAALQIWPATTLGSWSAATWLAGSLSMALQLVACLALAAVVARRTGRHLGNWLLVGFGASIVPVAGLLGMAAAAALLPRPAHQSRGRR